MTPILVSDFAHTFGAFTFPLQSELQSALEAIRPEQWSSLPEPAALQPYSREVLVDTPELLLIAARWRAGARCDLHGHSDSAGFYRVVSGSLQEERYVPRDNALHYEVEALNASDSSFLPAGAFHQLRALQDAVSIHAYAPRPDDAVSALSPDDLRQLDHARRNAGGNPFPSEFRITPNGDPRAHESVESLAATLAQRWQHYEDEAYRTESYRVPFRVLEDMRSSGILAAPLPRRSGGLAATLSETARAVSHLAEHAPAAALALVMPLGNAATCQIPLSAVPREQVAALRESQRWIARRVAQGKILAVANSEPGAGGNLSNTKTTATLGDDGIIRLSGRKTFATLGPDADYFLCAARTPIQDGSSTTERIEGYFIHRDAPGLAIDDRWDPFGMRPTASVGLQLENVPAECRLGHPGCLEGVNARHWSTLLFSAVFIGIGRASLKEGLQHVGPSAWGRAKLAEHALQIDAASGFLESVCESETWPMPAALLKRVQHVKTFITQAVVQTATQVAVLSGGRCYAPRHRVYRLLADSLAGPLLRPPLGNAMDSIIDSLDQQSQ